MFLKQQHKPEAKVNFKWIAQVPASIMYQHAQYGHIKNSLKNISMIPTRFGMFLMWNFSLSLFSIEGN